MRHLVDSGLYNDDTQQIGGSATGFAELVEDQGTTSENEYSILPPRPGASPEEAALYEFKQKLAKKGKITLEAFFRACDTTYSKQVAASEFKSKLEGL